VPCFEGTHVPVRRFPQLFDQLLQAPDQTRNVLGLDENANIVAILGAWIFLPNADMAAVCDVSRQRQLLLAR
jgi:hypothetical protein